MKKLMTAAISILLMLSLSGLAMAISFENGNLVEPVSLELGEADPKAVQVEEQVVDHVENGEHEDTGDVFVRWSKGATVKYGCDLASIDYTNPGRSNMGVKLELMLYDDQAFKYFGTTFRSEEELNALAVAGLEALKLGAPNVWTMDKLLMKGIVVTDQYEYPVSYEDLLDIIVENGYLGYTKEQWLALDEETILRMPEYEKLMIAQFGDYKFKLGNFLSLGETGVLPQGYAINEIQLHTFGDNYTLPAGNYNAQFWIVGYDALKGEYSKFGSSVPVTLHVQQDLPKNLQEEYGIKLAVRVD